MYGNVVQPLGQGVTMVCKFHNDRVLLRDALLATNAADLSTSKFRDAEWKPSGSRNSTMKVSLHCVGDGEMRL